MARAKAQYRGGVSLKNEVKSYSDELRGELRQYFPDKEAVEDPAWGHPADEFVNRILNAADWAVSMIHHMQEDVSNEDLKAEYANLLKILQDAEKKLRTISLALDQLISADAEPERLADQLRKMVDYLKPAKPRVDQMPPAKRQEQKKIPIAIEMVVQVFSVLDEYRIKPTACVNTANKSKMANAVKILQKIGDEIGLSYDRQTWRRRIKEAISK